MRRIASLVRLVSELEEVEPYVDTQVLEEAAGRRQRRASRSPDDLGRLLQAAVSQGVLLSEPRQRLDRASGKLVDTRLYRVNYKHPRARAALQLEE